MIRKPEELGMFLSKLNEPQKCAFVSLAKAFVKSDGVLLKSETEMLSLMKFEMGLDTNAEGAAGKVDELLAAFNTPSTQKAALFEIIGLGHSDSDYSCAESKFVSQMAKAFGICDTDLAWMENWVLRQTALVREADAFMREK